MPALAGCIALSAIMPISAESPEKITEMLIANFKGDTITIAAPVAIPKKGEFVNELIAYFKKGYYRFAIDGKQYRFKSEDDIKNLKLGKTYKHSIDFLIDAIEVQSHEQLALNEAVETAGKLRRWNCKVIVGDQEYLYSSNRMCTAVHFYSRT